MTIVEALRESKQNGRAYDRPGSGWIRWDERHLYKFFAEDLIADDWELVGKPSEERT